jgi:hypothetical protein
MEKRGGAEDAETLSRNQAAQPVNEKLQLATRIVRIELTKENSNE